MKSSPEHHTVLIVGGGPAGLSLAVVLGGSHPYYRDGTMFNAAYSRIGELLRIHKDSLLKLDFAALSKAGIAPVDLFRLLHHPSQQFSGLDEVSLDFRMNAPLDYLMLSREPVGGIWNNAPDNLLTLSPGHWMELAFYPLARYAQECGKTIDVDALIRKRDLIDYYHSIPERFGQTDRIHTDEDVFSIRPHERGFLVSSRSMTGGDERQYTATYLVMATGQRGTLRRLGVPGEDLPFVSNQYRSPDQTPGSHIAVIGGGRSSDWAATELFDSGRKVTYIMRQTERHHWQLIDDSRQGLPYYARLAHILESGDDRFKAFYGSRVRCIEEDGEQRRLIAGAAGEERTIDVDQVVVEIGGDVDYSILEGYPPLRTVEKFDPYRFQCNQIPIRPHSYESVDIPNLYPGGYLAEGIGLVVIAMHGTTYAIAADILAKEGLNSGVPLN
ncbi:MAG: NAD(P)-binding domain-containing protein [Candidatus Latescibacteria bacterium]|nr:NAD(P)-binding domain-containing protein [Candidatus Latescibacterota bacterium]